MTDTQQTKLKTALDTPYYAGDYSQAAVDFFRQSDVVLAQTLGQSGSHQQPAQNREWQQPSAASGVSANVSCRRNHRPAGKMAFTAS